MNISSWGGKKTVLRNKPNIYWKWMTDQQQTVLNKSLVTSWERSGQPSSCMLVSGISAAHFSSTKAEPSLELFLERCQPGWLWRRTPLSQLSSRSEWPWAVCTCKHRRERSRGKLPWNQLLRTGGKGGECYQAEAKGEANRNVQTCSMFWLSYCCLNQTFAATQLLALLLTLSCSKIS